MEKTKSLKQFYILWSTQSLSHLGSAMTSFALTLWLYDKTGSALSTAALRICTYAPYVVMSIFAGALSDKYDKKKTMLVCDVLAALTTVLVFVLYKTDTLSMWHLYAVNAVSGLMNTVQQPASEVANTLVVPKEHVANISEAAQLPDAVLASLLRAIGKIAAQEGLEKGYRVVSNCGPDACQSVPHLHFHILGGRQMADQMA